MRTSIPARFSAAGYGFKFSRRSAEHGFTLVELMVVIAIIGFVSAAVVLAMPDPRGRMMDDADRFAARMLAARDNAVVQARPMSVWVSASGYGFEQRSQGRWLPIGDKPFVTTNWRAGTTALVGANGRGQISFDSTGAPDDPLSIRLVRDGEQVSVHVDLAGKVRVGG